MNNKLQQCNLIKDDLLSLDTHELKLVKPKQSSNQLAFAVMLKFFQLEGHYPVNGEVIPEALTTCLANQLGIEVSGMENFNWENRSIERFRGEIRKLLGYRKFATADSRRLITWLLKHVLPQQAPTKPQCFELAYQFFRNQKLEPCAPKKLERYILKVDRLCQYNLI